MLRGVSELANAYGCVPIIYSAVAGKIAKFGPAEDLCIRFPCVVIEIAVQTHNRALLSKATNYVIGKRNFLRKGIERLPSRLARLVHDWADAIDERVMDCWKHIDLLLDSQTAG